MKSSPRIGGFTVSELMIAIAVTSVLATALLSSSIGLQKLFKASEEYATDIADQTRAMDYITRDARRAIPDPSPSPGVINPVAIDTSVAGKVTMWLPDYDIDYTGYPTPAPPATPPPGAGKPVPPSVSSSGKVTYGQEKIEVSYYIEGTDFVRLEHLVYHTAAARTGATGFTSQDIGKYAYQKSDGTYWKLTAASPATWVGATIGQKTIIATNVDGFTPNFATLAGNLDVTLTFKPKFRISGGETVAGSTKIGTSSSRRNAMLQQLTPN